MASAPVLEIDALLNPIAGDDPAGAPPSFSTVQQLDTMRKPGDPFGPPVKQDWDGIVQLAAETLVNTSKDILVASRLVEGVTMQHGLAGLRDGLAFFNRLLGECWDRMRPVAEDGETLDEVRQGPVNWLNTKFPVNLSAAPLLVVRGEAFSHGDWKGGGERRIDFEAALPKAKPDDVRNMQADLQEAKAHLEQLGKTVDEKMPNQGINLTSGMGSIGTVLDEIARTVKDIVSKSGVGEDGGGGDAAADDGDADDEPAAGPARKAGKAGGVSRGDLYRQIEGIAEVLQKMEPHSPIPYLLKRAVRLGAMPFPQMMRDLMYEDTRPLDGLDKMLGIEEQQE
ncbi:MAG TPA: type VI secretion system ImpA family N-terminal domain-containing protein [Gemmataceae bacterium]|jgi:type VI secretion system protein ImpA|nr:type VI secretion system ImpA family N-terminal domain-containing protein [Gemmataceae bacterium]